MKKYTLKIITILTFFISLSFSIFINQNLSNFENYNEIVSSSSKSENVGSKPDKKVESYVQIQMLMDNLVEIDIFSLKGVSKTKGEIIVSDRLSDGGTHSLDLWEPEEGDYDVYRDYEVVYEGNKLETGIPVSESGFADLAYYYSSKPDEKFFIPLLKVQQSKEGDWEFSKKSPIVGIKYKYSTYFPNEDSEQITIDIKKLKNEYSVGEEVDPIKLSLLSDTKHIIKTSTNMVNSSGENILEFSGVEIGQEYKNVTLVMEGFEDKLSSPPFDFKIEEISKAVGIESGKVLKGSETISGFTFNFLPKTNTGELSLQPYGIKVYSDLSIDPIYKTKNNEFDTNEKKTLVVDNLEPHVSYKNVTLQLYDQYGFIGESYFISAEIKTTPRSKWEDNLFTVIVSTLVLIIILILISIIFNLVF